MSSFNKVVLMGRLTSDPVIKQLPSNTPVANFTLAVNEVFYKDEQKKEETTFVDCQLFGKRTKALEDYVHKGDSLLIEGKLKKDSWDDKESGQKRSKMYVQALDFKMLSNRRDQQEDSEQTNDRQGTVKPSIQPKGTVGKKKDSDIPF
jgi:single-strand DNA-binding protein